MILSRTDFACGACPESVARERGCPQRGFGRPACAPFEQVFQGRTIERWGCPINALTPEQGQVLRAFRHYEAGRALYPTIQAYPNRLLKQLEAVESEVAANRLASKEAR